MIRCGYRRPRAEFHVGLALHICADAFCEKPFSMHAPIRVWSIPTTQCAHIKECALNNDVCLLMRVYRNII